jgi:hypothetical protein
MILSHDDCMGVMHMRYWILNWNIGKKSTRRKSSSRKNIRNEEESSGLVVARFPGATTLRISG